MIAALLKKYSLNARVHVTCLSSYCAGISEVFLMSIFEFHLVEYICLQLSGIGHKRMQMIPLGCRTLIFFKSTSEQGCLRLEYFELFDLHMLLMGKSVLFGKGFSLNILLSLADNGTMSCNVISTIPFTIDFDTNYIFAIAFQRN